MQFFDSFLVENSVDKWNKTIAKGDFVYILGDFCLGNKEYTEKILNRLKGRKFLIRGNHDNL